MKDSTKGLLYGLLAVCAFSVTLPATRAAVAYLDPLFVGLGRELVAAFVAAPLLRITRQRWPDKAHYRGLALVSLGVVFGFPVFTAIAMGKADASHGAVVLGLLPLATAIAGFALNHERPSLLFWVAAVIGSATVVTYALSAGAGTLHVADFALLAAVVFGALGYAEGARLAPILGAWQVICWAVVFSAPLLLPIVAFVAWRHGLHAPPAAWSAFAYVSVISALVGFFPWYRGLSLGGVARVSQIMLLQPFITLGFAAILLGERITVAAVVCALVIALSIFVSRRSAIHHRVMPA